MNVMLRAKDTGELNIDRVFARLFVVLGGIFWIAAFATQNTVMKSYTGAALTLPELTKGATTALTPLVLVVAVFVLGMFYERLTGIVLVVVALAMIVWGFAMYFKPDDMLLWITAFSVLVLPTLVSAALFELAARRQEAQELAGKLSAKDAPAAA
jgi:hypothetical protein